jgi:hypothetical protein
MVNNSNEPNIRREDGRSRRNSKIVKPNIQTSNTINARPKRFMCLIVLFLCIAVLLAAKYPKFIQHNIHKQGDIIAKLNDIVTLPLQPNKDHMYGLDHYYMLPSSLFSTKTNNTATGTPTRGILIYLHSCHQSGLEFFHLPEHRIIAYDALQKGLAILAPSSQDRMSGCFTRNDMVHLNKVVNDWAGRHNLRDLPRVGMGDSSGASFLFFVYSQLNLRSMAIYNSPQGYRSDNESGGKEEMSGWESAIPTIFLTMPLDKNLSKRMLDHKSKLQSLNVSTQLVTVTPRPFTESLCAARLPELPHEFCTQKVFQALEKEYNSNGKLLNADGFVKAGDAGTAGQWFQFFQKLEAEYQPIRSNYLTEKAGNGRSWLWAVLEHEIKSCQAYHGMSAEWHDEILQFLLDSANIADQEEANAGVPEKAHKPEKMEGPIKFQESETGG